MTAPPHTVAIIQARMSSRRLPGKTLMDVAGDPLLSHVVRRAEAAGVFDAVIVATSTDPTDDPVEAFCASRGISCFRGSLEDVLERYEQAAIAFGAKSRIARLTADCPLLDPAVIAKVVHAFDLERHDYVSNVHPRTYPKGLDTEVFSRAALARAASDARDPFEREHVTPFFYRNPALFRLGNVSQDEDRSMLRWTVDEPEDLAFVRRVFRELGNGVFGQAEILDLLASHPVSPARP